MTRCLWVSDWYEMGEIVSYAGKNYKIVLFGSVARQGQRYAYCLEVSMKKTA